MNNSNFYHKSFLKLNIENLEVKKKKENTRDINYFTIFLINYLYGKWLLISEKNDVSGGLKWKSVRIGHINIL